ncbi:hypothetical protein [Gemmatimonas sp.]|uniref:hypothetical protein n=1 Tax=Gemmatimonas sp. TaxID=1962908 RepID=UPI0037C0FA32
MALTYNNEARMTQIRLQFSSTTPPGAITSLRLLALVAVHGVHDATRSHARELFSRHARPAVRLAVAEHYGVRAARGAFETVVDGAIDRLRNAGGLEVGVASDAALWQVIRAAVWPMTVTDNQPELRVPLVSGRTGVLHNVGADEVTALLRLVRPVLGSEDFIALWIAARGPALPDVVAHERAHRHFEKALLQWALERPAMRGYADHVATLVA